MSDLEPVFLIQRVYLKEASLEQPNSPQIMLSSEQPAVDVGIAVDTLQVASENAQAARGRIMDADFAQETANMTRAQILQQAGTAMVSQANSMPNNVLSLLR